MCALMHVPAVYHHQFRPYTKSAASDKSPASEEEGDTDQVVGPGPQQEAHTYAQGEASGEKCVGVYYRHVCCVTVQFCHHVMVWTC